MQIIELTPEHEQLYFLCLEDWSDEMKEAGDHKEIWYTKMKDKGVRVKLAKDDKGEIGGMIQYLPIEHSYVLGKDLYFILCVWVHGYKQGRGNFQKKGMGKALLKAAEDDARGLGAKGICAWGISLPFWMKASWFKKQGYEKVDKMDVAVLLWKRFTEDASPPKWVKVKRQPQKVPGKVTVYGFINGCCPAQNIVFERAKRASSEFGDEVEFKKIETTDRDTFLEWGIADALYIDDVQVQTGPPPSYKKIRKIIKKKVKKLK
jgi:N-acetylglutamate synthase-like GNAT family acetyltransferase